MQLILLNSIHPIPAEQPTEPQETRLPDHFFQYLNSGRFDGAPKIPQEAPHRRGWRAFMSPTQWPA